MGLRSKGKHLSFEILTSAAAASVNGNGVEPDAIVDSRNSDSILYDGDDDNKPSRRRRKQKKLKKKKSLQNSIQPPLNPIVENDRFLPATTCQSYSQSFVQKESVSTVCQALYGELRQRSVNNNSNTSVAFLEEPSPVVENRKEEVNTITTPNSSVELNGNGRLQNAESLDWKRFMAQDSTYPLPVENSPTKYFMEEMYSGNSLRSTTTPGNEKEREKVYDTIFRLPWRCELLIDVGFFVCFNSFLSLLTIMPMRVLMMLWRLLTTWHLKPSPAELSDLGCFVVLTSGITLLELTDISLIYHMIRGQGTIKLYVVYNVLEIFDKLWQSFGGDVFQTLFNSSEEFACCSPESSRYWIQRYVTDLLLAAAATIVHSFILLAQAITLSTCIVAHNNALMALLVSNNFAEIKSNVFKRFSKDNVHSIVYSDSVERFHITAFLLFVLAQNILEAEGSWFGNFLSNALLVYFCEVAIDIVKHSFVAKFNDIKPSTYSDFLEDLCKQTMNMQNNGAKNHLTFVPVAPACVVIRVLTPVYAARLPCSPLLWRLFWIIFLTTLSYVMLASLKVMMGMGLRKHADWYIKRCQKKKLHSD